MKTIHLAALATVTGGAGTGFNTGITGGIKGVKNNKVPRPRTLLDKRPGQSINGKFDPTIQDWGAPFVMQ